MKKVFALILAMIFNLSVFAINDTNGYMNVQVGAELVLPIEARLFQIGNHDLPSIFDNDTIVLDGVKKYYFEGKSEYIDYQIIFSGITASSEIRMLQNGSVLKKGTILGKATSSPVIVNIRCKEFNIYFNEVTNVLPVFEDGYYYFGVGMLMESTPKFLEYKVINSSKDDIEFWDYPDSLENLYKKATEPDEDGIPIFISLFPVFQVCLETRLLEYPIDRVQKTQMEVLLTSQYFMNCSHMLVHEFDGIPMRLYFQNGFEQYLKNEYILGDLIYIYVNVIIFNDGEFYCYVRDFTLKNPGEIAKEKNEMIKAMLAENAEM